MMYADDNQLYIFMHKKNRAVALQKTQFVFRWYHDQKCVLMKKPSKLFYNTYLYLYST